MPASSKDLLEQLSNASGTPGNEADVRAIIRQHLDGLVGFSHDRLGSLVCRKQGSKESPLLMLAGHMDETGFIVRYLTNEGFVKFHPLGSWWEHTLLAQQVTIRTAKGDIPGIIGAKPVHHLKEVERKNMLDIEAMFIDVGAGSKREAMEEFGISPGDPIVPRTALTTLRNPRFLSGKAFDNRVGVALFVDALKTLGAQEHPNTICGVGTVQEEIGTRGAETAAHQVNPDIAVVLEGSPADDFPDSKAQEAQGVLGKGPQIRLFDPTMITNRKFSQFVIETARACRLPYQVAVRTSGGTDAKPIHLHRTGVPTIVLGVPIRYAHSHVGILNLDDYEHTLQLLIELLKRLDAKTVASFTEFHHRM
ncbi:MAG: M42 family metallopeptidase [Desulfobacterales bacterium]|nr:M42 family metallopeptidase [Desulfobacterales bacterium]